MCNSLSHDKIIEILNDILESLSTLENVKKLEDAKENVGNEMFKVLQYVFPVVMEMQMEVLKKHGLPDHRDGLIMFTQYVRSAERESPEIARLYNQYRSHFFPPLNANVDCAPEADNTSSN